MGLIWGFNPLIGISGCNYGDSTRNCGYICITMGLYEQHQKAGCELVHMGTPKENNKALGF